MRRFGVQLSAARVEAFAYANGIAKQGAELTAAQKAQASYGIIMQDTKLAQGDATRTADSFANQFKRLQNQVTDTATEMAIRLLPVITSVVSSFTAFITQMREGNGLGGTFVAIVTTIGGAFATMGAALISVVTWFREHMTITLALGAALTTLGAVYVATLIPGIIASTAAIAANVAAWVALRVAMLANPFVLLAVLLAALVAGIVIAYRESETFRNIVNGAFNAVRAVGSSVFGFLRSFIPGTWIVIRDATTGTVGGIRDFVSSVWNGMRNGASSAWGGIKNAITGAVSEAASFVRNTLGSEGLTGWLASTWDNMRKGAAIAWELFKNVTARGFGGIANTVIGFVNNIIDAINWVLDKIGADKIGKLKSVGVPDKMNAGEAAKAAGFARGGAFARTGGIVGSPMVMMGEEAPRHKEFVIPTNPAYRSRAQGLLAQAAGAIGFAEGGVISAFNRAIKATNAGPKASLALWMAGIVESNLRNLPYGDADSRGALQVRDSTARGMGLNNMDPFAVAMAFLTRGYWGKGSAISLAAGNPTATAGWVAQQVQGSAFPERYDLVRAQAAQFLKGGGGGGGGILSDIAGAVTGILGQGIDAVMGKFKGMLPDTGKLPDWLAPVGSFLTDKVTGWIRGKVKGFLDSVTGGGGGAIPKGVAGSVQAAIKLAQSIGSWRPSPGQLTGGRHAPGSLHYAGRAVDFGDAGQTSGQMKTLWQALYSKFGSSINELFYDPMPFHINNHKKVSGPFGGHGDHIHIGFARGGVWGGAPFVGSYRNGGVVPRDGLAAVHANETIIPAGAGGGPLMYVAGDIHFHDESDEARLVRRLAWAVETA
jgi:hypothetical protein